MSVHAPLSRANWGFPPFNREGFLKVQELFPTALVRRDPGRAPYPVAPVEGGLLETPVMGADGATRSARELFEATYTDGFLAMKDGVVVEETYWGAMTAGTPHLVNSVTKSFVGLLAGIAVAEGRLDPEAPIAAYVPELGASTAWAGTTVRHALDMTAGAAYGEDYSDRTADFWREASIVGWRDVAEPGLASASLLDYAAARYGKTTEDGACFAYKTLCTNVLGMVLEAAFAEPLAQSLSTRIWSKLPMRHDGAVVVDPARFPYVGAGLNACVRDLAQFGRLLAGRGTVDGEEIVPQSWLDETFRGGATSKQDFAAGEYGAVLEGWHYRNQIWVSGGPAPVFYAIGIHGQYVLADPAAGIVLVKVSSQPMSLDLGMGIETFLGFEALLAALR